MRFSRSRALETQGFTLVELLVGLAVGALVLLSVLVAWGISVGTTGYTLEAARLNHDLRTTMQIVVQDLRRADAGSVRFSDDDRCVSFTVSPRPSKIASGVCNVVDPDDPECWVVRGFRLSGNDFQMYLSTETAPPAIPICSVAGGNWSSIYGDLAAGPLVVDNFSAECAFKCLDLEEGSDGEEGPFSGAACSPVDATTQRCAASSSYASWVERLSVELTLGGAVQSRGQEKRMELQDTVSLRNNEVRL